MLVVILRNVPEKRRSELKTPYISRHGEHNSSKITHVNYICFPLAQNLMYYNLRPTLSLIFSLTCWIYEKGSWDRNEAISNS